MDVLFIIPPVANNYILDIKWEDHFEFLGVGYILSVLRKDGVEAEVLDAENLSFHSDHIINIILEIKPEILAFSVAKSQAKITKSMIKQIRNKGFDKPIILGGYYPTLAPEEMLDGCNGLNLIVRGEGEHVVSKLIQSLLRNEEFKQIDGISYLENGSCIHNPPSNAITDLDSLPFPSRDTLPLIMAIGGDPYLISSRGCYASCSFCSIKAFYKNNNSIQCRIRSVENIVNEMEMLINKFNIQRCRIFDDNLFMAKKIGRKRVIQLADEILMRKIKIDFEIVCRADDVDEEVFTYLVKAGLKRVVIGLESFNDNSLKYYGKKLKAEDNYKAMKVLDSLGVECVGSYILFNPESTFEEIEIDLNYFYTRLEIDKGINLINCILSTSTVLSIDEGTVLFQNADGNYINDEYVLKDLQLNKLKKISVYISISLETNLLKLVEIEKYYKVYIKNKNETRIREQLNELWYELAKLNLDVFRMFFDQLAGLSATGEFSIEMTDEITSYFYKNLNHHYNRIMQFIERYKIERNIFPRVWFYYFKKANKQYVYEPVSATFHKIGEDVIRVLELLYQEPIPSVEERVLSEDNAAIQALDWVKKQIDDGGFIKEPKTYRMPNENIMKRTIRQIIR
ncbi:radical SAM protein [Paenibacillus sp. FSL K6-1096]|uniref:B12-binding domain-containing radical SAM protein n=1 Tax=Paenibacillus sp. FSL K6-1096 TaxID=2921460 RepID=UPI0030ECE5E0